MFRHTLIGTGGLNENAQIMIIRPDLSFSFTHQSFLFKIVVPVLFAQGSWCADHCNENKDFYYFSQSKSLLVSRNAEKNLKNNSETNSVLKLIRGISTKLVLFLS